MKISHNYYVYIAECRDDLYYTGITNDLERRITEHNEDKNIGCFTYNRRPVKLKYRKHFYHVVDAIDWDKQLKGWPGKKKEALFVKDFETIKTLAKSKSSKTQPDSDDPSLNPGCQVQHSLRIKNSQIGEDRSICQAEHGEAYL